jgi:hypothetical protein
MLKFILFACLITKGGTHQECAPSKVFKTKAERIKNIEVVEADAFREGFFVRATCQEFK